MKGLWMMQVAWVVVGLVRIDAFGRGAPGDVEKTKQTVCEELMPLHFNASLKPSSTNPFHLSTSPVHCEDQQLVVIVQVASEEVSLLGFMLQARDGDGRVLGSFDTSYTPNTTLTCQGTSLSQKRRLGRKRVEMKWLVPCHFEGKVKIWAMLMENVTVFWKVSSDEITISPQREKCACLGRGTFECTEGQCRVQWWKQAQRFHFILQAPISSPDSYVAIALSEDNKMGDDLVVYCYHNSTHVKLGAGKTDGRSFQPLELNTGDVDLVSGSFTPSNIFCHFSSAFNFHASLSVNPSLHQYVLLVVKGPHDNGHLHMHNEWYMSKEPIDFAAVTYATHESFSKRLMKLHGALMVVAWMFVASSCVPLPKHFKHTTLPFVLSSKPFWFFWHQIGMVTTSILTTIAFILIFIYVGAYSQVTGWSALHPLLGITVTILTITNPLMAIFRCTPTSPRRWLFNSLHQLFGLSAHALALICIFLAGSMPSLGLPWWWGWVVMAHCVWQVAVDFVLSAHTRATPARNEKDDDDDDDKPATDRTQMFKPCVFLIHVIVTACLSLVCLVTLTTAP